MNDDRAPRAPVVPPVEAAGGPDPWSALRAATSARVGLGRSGDAAPLRAVLDFQQAHAAARDAVHAPLDVDALEAALRPYPVVRVRSAAPDRAAYLRRPDLGRVLNSDPHPALHPGETRPDLVLVVADGLSATAVQAHAPAVVHACMARLRDWNVAPVVVATQARVALGDDVGERMGARLCAVLIGERPGLSVADSLGIYLTFEPRRGRRDSERNCISNIHARGGLAYDLAADKLAWLLREALRRGITGVGLKDEADRLLPPA